MLKLIKLSFFLIFSLQFFSSSFGKENYQNFLRYLKTIKLYFIQENYLPFESNPDSTYYGLFVFKKPNKFFIKYLWDEKGHIVGDYLLSDGKYVKIYISENNETKIVFYKNLMEYFPFSYLFSKDINRYFKVKYDKKKNVLYLYPKFKSDYNLISLKLTKSKKFPIKYVLINYSDKRKTSFVIKKVVAINFPLKNDIFKINFNQR